MGRKREREKKKLSEVIASLKIRHKRSQCGKDERGHSEGEDVYQRGRSHSTQSS